MTPHYNILHFPITSVTGSCIFIHQMTVSSCPASQTVRTTGSDCSTFTPFLVHFMCKTSDLVKDIEISKQHTMKLTFGFTPSQDQEHSGDKQVFLFLVLSKSRESNAGFADGVLVRRAKVSSVSCVVPECSSSQSRPRWGDRLDWGEERLKAAAATKRVTWFSRQN